MSSEPPVSSADLVVLVDEDGRKTGVADKQQVHTATTPLHLAFSCYVFDESGQLLLTRRALTKRTWPGVWTNSFCGHPRPDERTEAAVHRHAEHELGTRIRSLRLHLPEFRYRAKDAGGTVENEICPVFSAMIDSELQPSAEEVVEWRWVSPRRLLESLEATPFVFSPWMREQAPQLVRAGVLSGGDDG